MRKSISSHNGLLPLRPELADYTLRYEDFARSAEAYLRKELPADVLLELCALALESVIDDAQRKSVHKHRYLANIALGRLYDAMADALAILREFGDAPLHFEMMCSLCLKRNNYFRALEYVEKILSWSIERGLDVGTLEADRAELEKFAARIRLFSAEEFSDTIMRLLAREGAAAVRQYAGVPLQITGKARVNVLPSPRTPYLIFDTDEAMPKPVYCQMPENELPFIRHVEEGQRATAFGYLLSVDASKILLQPCRLIS